MRDSPHIMMPLLSNTFVTWTTILAVLLHPGLNTVHCDHLPDFITACKIGPGHNECGTRSAKAAIQPLINGGYKKFNMPELFPLFVPHVVIENGDFHLDLTNSSVTGLETASVLDYKADFEKREIKLQVHFKRLVVDSLYKVNGKLSVIALKGQGVSKLEFNDLEMNYTFAFNLNQRRGKNYIVERHSQLQIRIGKTMYNFGNLFDGNRKFSEDVNRILNENSDVVSQDLRPSVSNVVSAFVTQIIAGVVRRIPYEEIFPSP